jgi:hypothetical protein
VHGIRSRNVGTLEGKGCQMSTKPEDWMVTIILVAVLLGGLLGLYLYDHFVLGI